MWKRIYINSPNDSKENRHLYDIWSGIKKRCLNPKCARYKDYGARGIKVCDEWMNFDTFVEWAKSTGYSIGMSIDRIDNDGSYCASNCRWSTKKEQNRNKRTCIYIDYMGKRQSLIEWCEELFLPYYTIQKRIKHGMDPVKALETPIYDRKKSFANLCRSYNMPEHTVYDRVHKLGWDLERALMTPVKSKGCAS